MTFRREESRQITRAKLIGQDVTASPRTSLRNLMSRPNFLKNSVPVAGIDIGGEKKGCHLVVLAGGAIVCNTRNRDPQELAHECNVQGAQVIGVDAPCKWSLLCAENTVIYSETQSKTVKCSH